MADYCAYTSSGEPISVVLLVDALKKVDDWYVLGVYLDLEGAKLQEIEITYHVYGVVRMKIEMFKVWLKSCPDASWHKLVSALNEIGERRVAEEVESNYCKQLPGIYWNIFICVYAPVYTHNNIASCHNNLPPYHRISCQYSQLRC